MKHWMILALVMVMTLTAKAMNYETAKHEALFLSDKMAYELNLTNEQYDAVYEINFDYLICLNDPEEVFGVCWKRRNEDLKDVLAAWQNKMYLDIEYFYRPVSWVDAAWVFAVYDHYTKDVLFFNAPSVYATYRGGNSLGKDHFYAGLITDKPDSPNHELGPTPRPAESSAPMRDNGGANKPNKKALEDPASAPTGKGPGGKRPGGGAPMGGRR